MMNKLHQVRNLAPKYIGYSKINHLKIIRKNIQQALEREDNSDLVFVKLKVLFFPLLYIGIFIFTLSVYPNKPLFFTSYFILGILMVIIFLTVIHEVSHDNVFKKKWLNALFLYFFDILGANSFVWKKRHRLMHHNYPNVSGWDTDIEQSKLFKVFPHAPKYKIHKYQHYLMFILYPLYLFNWLFIRDFKDFFDNKSTIRKTVDIPKIEIIKLFFFKSFYLFYMFLVPVYFYQIPIATVVAGFICLTATASVFSLIVLLPPHANIENKFPQTTNNLNIPTTWLEHQLETTTDISNNNWFISFFMGNFNYHIAHHLFPNLRYSDLKIATQIIAKYAAKNGLNYKQYSMGKALKNHYYLIKTNALSKSFLEETF